MKDFQRYQEQFVRHIRDPKTQPRPDGVSARRMQVYNEIVFNNLNGLVSACFPVLIKVLGKRAWQALLRAFFVQHRCHTPIFREVPQEFLSYLASRQDLPPYVQDLAHYEWAELCVTHLDHSTAEFDAKQDLLETPLVFNPAMLLLQYDYPVHKISPRFKPKQPLKVPVHLVVFRHASDEVRFVELSPMTAQLLQALQGEGGVAKTVLTDMAQALGLPEPNTLIGFGAEVLHRLQQQGVILGAAVHSM